MKLLESEAIILQVTDLQERDRIVSFVTPTLGQKRGVAQGARTKFSRFQGTLHSLAEVEITWAEKSGRDLVRVRDVALIKGAANVPADLERLLVGQYFAESIERFTVEDEPAELEYRLLRSCIGALRTEVPVETLMRYFEVWLLQINGIFSMDGICPVCGGPLRQGALLPDEADSLVCRNCALDASSVGKVYGADVLRFIASCATIKPANLGAVDVRLLRQVEDLTRTIRRRFLGSSLRSYEVMKRTLAEVG